MGTEYQFTGHQSESAAITIQICNWLICQQSYSNVYGFNIHTFFDRRIFVPRLSPYCTIWTYGTLVAGCCPGNS